jgi:hypothetical protein|tara:strand:- start:106 stop:291 length:186 start_codon:yes stop_codon:yes gene_type:complete
MGLYEKIKKIYPKLTDDDFQPVSMGGKIELFDDGKGNQTITVWNNTEYTKPTQSELDAVED